MPYVHRDALGQIESLHRQPAEGASEFLPDEHPAVQAFVGRAEPGAGPGGGEGFDRLDADFVRVIEDVIDALIVKNLINVTDLPAEAQAKLFARRSFREQMTQHSLQLFGTPDPFAGVVKVGGEPV